MISMDPKLIPAINQLLGVNFPEQVSHEQLTEILSGHINELIRTDFPQLIFLLYRIDVHEEKLKLMLKDNSDEDAARIIATMIIERQLQKIKSRQENRRDNSISEEDKW